MGVSLPGGPVEQPIHEWVRNGSYGSRADVIAEAILLLADHSAGRERAGDAVRAKVAAAIAGMKEHRCSAPPHPGM